MLQKLIRYFKKDYNWVLLFILILAGMLRFIGTSPGYPPYHSDEGMSYSQGIAIIREGTLDAHGYPFSYAYPSLIPFVNAFFFKFILIPLAWIKFYLANLGKVVDGFLHIPPTAEEYKGLFQLEILGEREINVLFWGRKVTALFGTGVVLLTYFLGGKVFNKRVGLIAAFLVAVNYRQVLNSHISLPDIYNAFFLLLSLIFSYKLIKKPSLGNYALAGIFAGLSFSTKFQILSVLSLGLSHFYVSLSAGKHNFLRAFFARKAFLSGFSIILISLLLNPTHLVNWPETLEQFDYVSLKYRIGKKSVDFYPFSYLYHIGVGKALSLFALFGVVVGLFRDWKKTLWLSLPVLFSFFIFSYYTGGGFYTRNFISVTPLILIFAGFGVYFFSSKLSSLLGSKRLTIIASLALLLLVSLANIKNSMIVSSSYSQPWNFRLISQWLGENIPSGSKIAAHSSVPLPIESVERLPYDFHLSFSIEEFREDGAQFAVANLDWATNDFYWWMTRSTRESLRYWNKPVEIMEEMYPALAVRELTDFSLYHVLNSWQAPDSNFIVAKVPKYEILEKELFKKYTFEEGPEFWQEAGMLWHNDNNLAWENGYLVIKQGSAKSPVLRWESGPILVEEWPGFVIQARMKTESSLETREGFVAATFYQSFKDAQENRNRVAVRISARNDVLNEWVDIKLVGEVPKEAGYMKLRFQSYNPDKATAQLDEVEVYKASVEVDYGGVEVKPFYLDPDILFPFSHGGL